MLTGVEIGCIESHINVLSKTPWELSLILEDDFELSDNFDNKLIACLNELPDDFNALWLGGRVFGKYEVYSNKLLRISSITGTYGYIVKKSFIPDLLTALNKKDKLADWAMSSVFKNVFKSKENLVKHRAGYSVIKNKFVSYPDLE